MLTKQEQDKFGRLLGKIHDLVKQPPPEDVMAKAREILEFCRKHLPEDSKDHEFHVGRREIEIKADTDRAGFNWNKHYFSYEIVTHYKLVWSASWESAYHNDSIRHERAVVVGHTTWPFGLPNDSVTKL